MTLVPVYFSCTTSYEPILARALASWRRLSGLTADFRIDTFVLDAPNVNKLFKTDIWYACLLHKCEYFRTALGQISDPAVVSVFSDADIAVFPALARHWADIVDDMLARDLDCLFMREGAGTQVNGGLLVARATPRMQAFWSEVVEEFRRDKTVELGEQTLINRILPESELRWDYLDADKVVWAAVLPPSGRMHDLCFHHAVCADGIGAKGEQMDRIADAVMVVQRSLNPESTMNPLACTEPPRRQPRAHIVLCRYDEDISCLDHWLGHDGCKVFVYDRGPHPWVDVPPTVTHITCNNVGREGYVYLQHTLAHYDALPDVVVFSQCDVRDVPRPIPLERLLAVRHFGAACYNVGQGFLLATRWCQGENQGLGYIEFPANSKWWKAWMQGDMARAHQSIGDFYLKYVDARLPPVNRCVTTLTGTYAAARQTILGRSREYYSRLQQTLADSSDPEVGHYVERLQAHIMLGPHAALCVRDGLILS